MLGVFAFLVSEWALFRNLERLRFLGYLLVAQKGEFIGRWWWDVALAHAWKFWYWGGGIEGVSA